MDNLAKTRIVLETIRNIAPVITDDELDVLAAFLLVITKRIEKESEE